MEPTEHPASVRVGVTPDGMTTYLVDRPPEALPSVLKRDLERAWQAAHDAALARRRGAPRGVRFQCDDGSYTDLAIADRDARCWVGAVDVTVGMGSSYGLSLCLRLLALVDLLARAPWAAGLCRLDRNGADLDPTLLRTAASMPLSADAQFDEAGFRGRLARFALCFALEGEAAPRLSGPVP
jgi:hypothetical protein